MHSLVLISNPTVAMKLLSRSPWIGAHSFEAMSLQYPHLPGKAIELFFSTSPKTLANSFLHKYGIQMELYSSITLVNLIPSPFHGCQNTYLPI